MSKAAPNNPKRKAHATAAHEAATATTKPKGLLKRWFPKRYKRARVFLIIVCILVAARIALPYIVLYVVNNRLEKVPGYYGHVDDVDISIFRGAYVLKEIFLDQVDSVSHERTPFLAAHKIDLSVEWAALFKGHIVGEVEADSFMVIFTKDKMEPQQIKEDKNVLKELGDDFMPLKLNRVELRNSSVHYIDKTSSPHLDLFMTDLDVLAKDLSTEEDSTVMPSTLLARGKLFGGVMLVGAKLNLLSKEPTFDVNAQVTSVNLVELNSFFKAYAKLDVNKGDFNVYMEAASREGKLKGYVKPIIHDLDILGPEDRDDGALQKLWEAALGTVGFIFTNQKHDQFATKLTFEGTLKDTKADIWFSIYELVRNAFIEAMRSTIDNEINVSSLAGVTDKKDNPLKGLFKDKDKVKDKKADSHKGKEKGKEKEKEAKRAKRKSEKKSNKD